MSSSTQPRPRVSRRRSWVESGRRVSSALIVTDMLNPYEDDDAEPLMDSAREIVEPEQSKAVAFG